MDPVALEFNFRGWMGDLDDGSGRCKYGRMKMAMLYKKMILLHGSEIWANRLIW